MPGTYSDMASLPVSTSGMNSLSAINGHGPSSAHSGEILILDDLIRQRAADSDQIALLAFPKSERGITDYEELTGQRLDQFIDQAAKYYVCSGLRPANGVIVALLGATDLPYVITFFALSRIGYTTLCLSNRLAPSACVALLDETGCNVVVPGRSKHVTTLVAQVQQERSVKSVPIVCREDFDKPGVDEPPIPRAEVDPLSVVTILHSSGSTGLPKAIYLSHKRLMTRTPPSTGRVEFTTFPWFHGYGNWVGVHGMYERTLVYFYNSNLPLTGNYMVKAIEHIRPDILHVVPYSLKLLVETQGGIDAMKACGRVIFSGTGCPDVLGTRLIHEGINLETFWGATEIGGFGNSFNRPKGDDSWDYVRVLPPLRPHLWMKPIEDGTYEAIYLKGLPTLVASNSDDPPGSFHSKDIFIPHATIPHAWKHIGRLDDRLTLTNGEKVLPLRIEGHINEDPRVKEAVVFGAGESIPGLLVFRSDAAKDMSDENFIDAIWPTVQKANEHAERFSQMSKETVIPLPAGIDFPRTDKDSIKRVQIYRAFSDQIENMYSNLGNRGTGVHRLQYEQMKKWLMGAFKDRLGLKLTSVHDDFFAAGVDSLQAIQMRGIILKELDLGGNGKLLGENVVFDTSDVARLAEYLCALRSDPRTLGADDEIETMTALIEKYSVPKEHVPGSALSPQDHVVVLTGATGSLGAHILAQLLDRTDVRKVYCLSRGRDPLSRILQGLQQRNLSIPSAPNLIALESDLSREDLGVPQDIFQEMLSQTTLIIHSAWAVNFMLGIRSFEDQHIKGVQNLINFSLSVHTPNPARFYFCSSISVALAAPAPAVVPEALIEDLTASLPMGYSRSKLVAEHIIRNVARGGAPAHVLRIGQIVGDSKDGLWNDSEAIPLMIRSALTLRVLPALDETCSWLPVDFLASSILSIALPHTSVPISENPPEFYNLINPHTFPWTTSLLPALRAAGLSFTTVPTSDWLVRLKEASLNPQSDNAVLRNPALKLVDYFERMYSGAGNMMQKSGLEFDTAKARERSPLGQAPQIVEEGYVDKFLGRWMRKWGEETSLVISSEATEKRKREAAQDTETPAAKRLS